MLGRVLGTQTDLYSSFVHPGLNVRLSLDGFQQLKM